MPDKRPAIFPADSHRQVHDLLDTTAALRGVMLLTEAPGCGKSTLLKTWMRSLEPKRHFPLLITQSSISANSVLEVLHAKLGERSRFERSSVLLLEKHYADIDPLTLVLILDDAQNYPAPALEEIRILLGFGGRLRSAFVLILAGAKHLLGSLRLSIQRALLTRISAAMLAPMAREASCPYLNWQDGRAGLERAILEPAAIDLLAEASQGNPHSLNLLAHAAWLAAARIHPEHIHSAMH